MDDTQIISKAKDRIGLHHLEMGEILMRQKDRLPPLVFNWWLRDELDVTQSWADELIARVGPCVRVLRDIDELLAQIRAARPTASATILAKLESFETRANSVRHKLITVEAKAMGENYLMDSAMDALPR